MDKKYYQMASLVFAAQITARIFKKDAGYKNHVNVIVVRQS